jgi:hypothetical protein
VTSPLPDAELLRRLLGRTVIHEGQRYRVIEVLDEKPLLVLQSLDQMQIQPDLHGRAKGHSAVYLTLPILNEARNAPSIELMALRMID